MELLKQNQYSPLLMEEQVLVLYAGVKGYLDNIAIEKVVEFESKLLESFRTTNRDILDTIRDNKKLDAELEEKIKTVIANVTEAFN